MKKVVTFGELMLRLAPENYLRFVQSEKYEATFGGAEANVAVSHLPALPGSQRIAHDARTNGCAHTPHTVQPAHMPTLIMKSNIVVECCVDTSCAETIRNCPKTKHIKLMRK